MTITIRKRDGSTFIVGQTKPRAKAKPKGPTRYVLEGRPVKLSEAARILDAGLRTIMRHTDPDGVIDASTIRALEYSTPMRRTHVAPKPKLKPEPYRGPAHFHDEPLRNGHAALKARNSEIIARIASAFEAAA